MEIAKLVLLCLASLCGYGAILGGLSAALCPEAFTLGCPPFFEHWPASALGAMWGALDLLIPATFTGLALGIAANFGPQPALKASFFRRIIPGLLGIMALVSLAGGAAGYITTRRGLHPITGPLKTTVAVESHPMLAAVWWASLGGLLALFASAMILALWIWRKRAWYAEILRNH
jgi:membrane associated rhomboid family serine protease